MFSASSHIEEGGIGKTRPILGSEKYTLLPGESRGSQKAVVKPLFEAIYPKRGLQI